MNDLQKYRCCFIAGLYAAGGSFFGKLPSAFKEDVFHETVNVSLNQMPLAEFILCQCLPIVLMIVCNLLNWRYFLKALQMSEQTVIATVLTAASNYVASFFLGACVFGEAFTLISVIGCTFIVLGLSFLCADSHSDEQQQLFKKKK